PKRLCASWLTSFRESRLGSNWPASAPTISMRSCPEPAEISAATAAVRSARLMWSTTTSMPFAAPHSRAYWSNQVSYAGTKWLHCKIRRLPPPCARSSDGPKAAAAAVAPEYLRKDLRVMRRLNGSNLSRGLIRPPIPSERNVHRLGVVHSARRRQVETQVATSLRRERDAQDDESAKPYGRRAARVRPARAVWVALVT